MFQNHYGWIETCVPLAVLRLACVFQNHYGWIETSLSKEAVKTLPTVSKPLRLD